MEISVFQTKNKCKLRQNSPLNEIVSSEHNKKCLSQIAVNCNDLQKLICDLQG